MLMRPNDCRIGNEEKSNLPMANLHMAANSRLCLSQLINALDKLTIICHPDDMGHTIAQLASKPWSVFCRSKEYLSNSPNHHTQGVAHLFTLLHQQDKII